ncbi:MAG TPA: DUF6572 domain-containing protein [Gaiellaceae bacterium]|nr:DUF6572 domain-containing protein [Gaiellaceae bacterium]
MFRRKRASPMTRSDTVDSAAVSPDGTQFGLSMSETRPWTAGTEQIEQFRDKLNAYMAFILDGQLDREYPESVGKRRIVILHCVEEPPEELYESAQLILQNHNIGFEVWPLDDSS